MKSTSQVSRLAAGPMPRREVMAVPPDIHGGIDASELEKAGIDPDKVLDFSVNINPFGPSPAVMEALARVVLDRYPDRDAGALRRHIAEWVGREPEQVRVGNGASELLALAAQSHLRRGDRALVLAPTYTEYARVSELAGARVHTWRARAEDEFAIASDEIEELLGKLRPRLVFVCRPNNPTGTIVSWENLAAWVEGWPGTLFVVDESYAAFVQGMRSAIEIGAENVLVVSSLTKDHALAGARLGFAVGSLQTIRSLEHVQAPWSVNAVAQAAGLASLRDSSHLEQTLLRLDRARAELREGLGRLRWRLVATEAPFFLFQVGDAAELRRKLLHRGILVRDGTSWGLAAWVRISTRVPAENARLLEALREVGG